MSEPGVVGAHREGWRGRGEDEGQDGLFVKSVKGESEVVKFLGKCGAQKEGVVLEVGAVEHSMKKVSD